MRGTVSAGMALALHERGLMSAFDAVYGSSAGAITGAWLLSSEPERLHGWAHPDYARTMIRWSALLRRRPVADVQTLVEVVYQTEWPMDFDSILASPVEYHPLATDAAAGESTDLRPMISDPAELRLAIRASAALPFLAGPPVRLRGRRYYDAGVAESIPFRTPIAQGATHVLVLRSRRPLAATDVTDVTDVTDASAAIDVGAGIDGWAEGEGLAGTAGEAGIGEAGIGEAGTGDWAGISARVEIDGEPAGGNWPGINGAAENDGAAVIDGEAGSGGHARSARSAAASAALQALKRARQHRRSMQNDQIRHIRHISHIRHIGQTRQTGQARPPRSYLLLTRTTLRNESPEFRTALLTRAARTAADVRAIAEAEAGGAAFSIFAPPWTPPVSRLTTDAVLLAAALESGRQAVNEVFDP
jgi:Patatin-like phospholipase